MRLLKELHNHIPPDPKVEPLQVGKHLIIHGPRNPLLPLITWNPPILLIVGENLVIRDPYNPYSV